jgi:hypothetical protein
VSIRILTTLVLLITSISATAAKIDINLNQDSARFNYYTLVGGSNYGRTEMNGGILYNQDKNMLLELGLQVIDAAGSKSPGLEIGVGPRLYYFIDDAADVSGVSIALGGDVRYKLPQVQRFALQGTVYYAPSITSTLEADSYLELGARASYEILPTADVYLGYRRIRIKYTKGNGEHTLDEGFMLGMNFSF